MAGCWQYAEHPPSNIVQDAVYFSVTMQTRYPGQNKTPGVKNAAQNSEIISGRVLGSVTCVDLDLHGHLLLLLPFSLFDLYGANYGQGDK